ncbi:hypothetical protein T03_14939 [Trichinella britovi]|uniref:FLYWCH-type domain-containing protein n=1 Tax=Trichinella britovi TaxID=45882 RepID=A0A0V1C8T7_TRIBR|nr:hypothetical protein T03_14939 [Trichinella britovi]
MSLVYEGRVYKLKYTGKQRKCWRCSKRDLLSAGVHKSSQGKDTLDHCLKDHQVGNLVTHVWVRAGPCGAGALSDDRKGEQQLVVAPPGCGNATKTPSAWRAKRRTERTKLRSVGDSPNQISKQIARDDRMVLLGVHAGHPPCR